mmetsp:Transcript_54873/g.80067  ORF Transcript_54873/g.80067 Transcript_54873/m.80067 type:complete len:114 (-) Transcript_54873:126-467(-)
MAEIETVQPFSTIREEIQAKINQAIDEILRSAEFNSGAVSNWSAEISQKSIETATAVSKCFKYTATCFITQKTDGGMSFSSATFWDTEMDGQCSVRWENTSLLCYVLLFACSL